MPNFSKVLIKINGLNFFKGVPKVNEIDYYTLSTNQVNRVLEVKLTPFILEDKSPNIWQKGNTLSNYIAANYDFTLGKDLFFKNDSIFAKVEKAVADNNQSPEYSFLVSDKGELSVFFGVANVIGLNKIVDMVESINGEASIACRYNHNILPGQIIAVKQEYIILEIQHKYSLNSGYIMNIFGKTKKRLDDESHYKKQIGG